MTEGICKPGFERVAEAFQTNFDSKGEVGASVCLTVGGETVVDLWGGTADPKTGAPWAKDTVSIVFSCTKGATALCAHVLASRGKLDLDAPVIELWPEFGQKGKEHVTTRMMLDHSAGVAALRAPVKDSGPYEWEYMTARLAAEEPFWPPGIRNGYHGFTFGWTVGKMVRRAGEKSLGAFFRDEIAIPLGLDFWIGLPEEIESRVAPIIPYVYKASDAKTPFMIDLATKRESIAALFYFNVGAWRTGGANTRAGHAAEIGAANGITNARGLAGMYAPLANDGLMTGGGKLVDGKTLARMGEVSMATHDDATLRIPTRFALGFMKSMDNRRRSPGAKLFGEDVDSVIMGSAAFGHVGAGGSLGFADPAAGLSFGYTMNRMGPGLLMNERGQALVDAAYLSLGYKNKDGGVWVR
jgi:CubicO group peptidase (beta-lactamase class C family)